MLGPGYTLSFTGTRESYLEKSDRIWIDCLNGDKYKTGKLTPDYTSVEPVVELGLLFMPAGRAQDAG